MYRLKFPVSNTKLQDLQRNTKVLPVHQGKGSNTNCVTNQIANLTEKVSYGLMINIFNSLKENYIKEIKKGIMTMDNGASDREHQ